MIEISYSGATDVGRRRTENQDAIFISKGPIAEIGSLFVIADGMGGAKGGSVAAGIAVESFEDYFTSAVHSTSPDQALRIAAKSVNDRIKAEAERNSQLSGMGTTLVALLIRQDGSALIANVGDSRAYLLRKNKRLEQITEDHSLVAEQVRQGALTENEAKNHKMKHVLTRAIGVHPFVEVDIFEFDLENNDLIMLCSDGLHGPVSDNHILQILKRDQTLDQISSGLIKAANDCGGPDNISAMLVRIEAIDAQDTDTITTESPAALPFGEDSEPLTQRTIIPNEAKTNSAMWLYFIVGGAVIFSIVLALIYLL